MSVRHEDLARVLESLSPELIQSVLRDLREGAHCRKSWRDMPEPGQEYRTGEDGLVSIDRLADIERIVGVSNFLPVSFLEEGAKTQRAVGRVALTAPYAGLPAGSGWGTGSLVAPTLLLTNNHVLPNAAMARNTRLELNYQTALDGTPEPVDAYGFDPDSLFVTDVGLDYTLVRVRCKVIWVVDPGERSLDPSDLTTLSGRLAFDPSVLIPGFPKPQIPRVCAGTRWGHLRLPPSGVQFAIGQYVNVIQHPQGRRKEVALQDNRITNVYTNVLRYQTDTEPGSSGSPVFDNSWNLVALHHAGGDQNPPGTWINNEGIRIDQIVSSLRTKLGALSGGAAVLTELGL